MSDLLNNPPLTARQLAGLLLALPNPDAPVFGWSPGTCWEINPASVHNHQAGLTPHSWVMLELDACTRNAVDEAARNFG
jgi:hypothetical protein